MRTSVLGFIIFIFCLSLNVTAQALNISPRHGPFYRFQRYLVLHHTEFSAENFPKQFDIVDRYHRSHFRDPITREPYVSSLGYCVGYTLFCEKDGTLIQARLIGEDTTAQLEHNEDSISICLAGNFDKEYPTKAQIKTLQEVLLLFQDYQFVFHGDLADRNCPGKHISHAWVNKLMGGEWVAKQEKITAKYGQPRSIDGGRTRIQKSKSERITRHLNILRRKHRRNKSQ